MRWHAGQSPDRRKAEQCDLEPLPTLEPKLEHFLGEPAVMQGVERGCNLSQEPSVENYKVWLEWRGHQLNMPDWWEELVAIPNVDDHCRLAQKVQASFEIPQVRCKALKVINDYSLPPTLKCISRKAFLPIPDPRMPREGQPWKTLAYAQALQYWAEKANLPKPGELHLLERCFHELRWAMRLFTTFTDGAVFVGTMPRLGILEEGAAKLSTTDTTRTPMPEGDLLHHKRSWLLCQLRCQMSQQLLLGSQPLSKLTRGLAYSPTQPETGKKVKGSPSCEFPSWTQIHSSHPVTPVGCPCVYDRSHRDARWIGGLTHQSNNLSHLCYSLQKVLVCACSNTRLEQHKMVNYPANL